MESSFSPSPGEQQRVLYSDAVAYSVCTASSPHHSSPVFDDLHKEDPSGRGWVLFLWLFGFGLCACVCVCARVCVYVDFFRTDLKVPERAWSPSPDGSLK